MCAGLRWGGICWGYVPSLRHMLYRLLGLWPPRKRASIVLLRCGGCRVVLDWVTFAGVVPFGRHVTAASQPTRAGPCSLFSRHLRQVPTVALFALGLPCSFLVILWYYLQGFSQVGHGYLFVQDLHDIYKSSLNIYKSSLFLMFPANCRRQLKLLDTICRRSAFRSCPSCNRQR